MRMVEAEGADRRRGMRIALDRPVKLLEPRLRRYIAGRTRDASASGLKLELPGSAPLGVGARVQVLLGIDGDAAVASQREMLPARIVWMQRGSVGARQRLLAGVELVHAALALDAA